MRNPARRRPYLQDPNYYRLGFQLVAQSLNLDAAGRAVVDDHPSHFEEAHPDRRALDVALTVLNDTGQMLRWYARRERAQWWRPRRARRLHARDAKLRDFLECTVEPCTRIAAAVSLRELGDGRLADELVSGVLADAASDEVSYRVHYSLACWFGRRSGAAREAVAHLSIALNRAPRDRAFDLADWATRDPSLQKVRHGPETEEDFRALIERFEPLRRKASSVDRRG